MSPLPVVQFCGRTVALILSSSSRPSSSSLHTISRYVQRTYNYFTLTCRTKGETLGMCAVRFKNFDRGAILYLVSVHHEELPPSFLLLHCRDVCETTRSVLKFFD